MYRQAKMRKDVNAKLTIKYFEWIRWFGFAWKSWTEREKDQFL